MSFFTEIEALLYAVSRIFLVPVMLLIAAALAYALVVLGMFTVAAWQRRRGAYRSTLFALAQQVTVHKPNAPRTKQAVMARDDLELWIMTRLERLCNVTRTAPCQGLHDTRIPRQEAR